MTTGSKSTIEPDPYANKAIAAGATATVGVLTQWLATGQFTLSQEGVTAIVGAVATLLVYLVSNRKRGV